MGALHLVALLACNAPNGWLYWLVVPFELLGPYTAL